MTQPRLLSLQGPEPGQEPKLSHSSDFYMQLQGWFLTPSDPHQQATGQHLGQSGHSQCPGLHVPCLRWACKLLAGNKILK